MIGDVYALVAHAVGDCRSAETHVDQQRYVTVPDVVNPDLFNAGYLTASLHLVLEVTHSVRAASCAGRVLFLRDGAVAQELTRGTDTETAFYRRIADALTASQTGGGAA